MKTIFPWMLAVIFAALAGVLFSSSQKRDLELATLRAQVQELETARLDASNTSTGRTEIDQNELERLRKESDEVYKLRNQVGQLQKRVAEMEANPVPPPVDVTQYQPPQPPVEDPTATTPEAPPEDPVTKQQREQCVENMKVIEEAKTMWAVANNKQAGERMTIQDITTALPNNGAMPLCPSGGVYSLNEVGIPVSCSLPDHSLLP